jgi:hypothetical protein
LGTLTARFGSDAGVRWAKPPRKYIIPRPAIVERNNYIHLQRGTNMDFDRLMDQYDTGQISRRQLIGLLALAAAAPAARAAEPTIGKVETNRRLESVSAQPLELPERPLDQRRTARRRSSG